MHPDVSHRQGTVISPQLDIYATVSRALIVYTVFQKSHLIQPSKPTRLRRIRRWAICSADILEIYFSDFCQTNYLNIYQTDLYEICSVGITLAVDERSEVIFFRSLKVRCHGKQVLFIHSILFSSRYIYFQNEMI